MNKQKTLIIVILFVVVLTATYGILWLKSCAVETFKVEDKERVYYPDRGDSKYLIFTNRGVFENTDTIFKMKFNSSDVYGKLKRGRIYTVEACGWRVQPLSWYKNIIKVLGDEK